jgi:ATP-dependent helicase/nuclease subunit B
VLRIIYGEALDQGTAWRHLLPGDRATLGFEAVGTTGLLRRLATLLGVPEALAEAGPRTAAWLARMDAYAPRAAAYARSFGVDAWGTASHLLALRDRLVLDGWDGRPLTASPRLADLYAVDSQLDAVPLPRGAADLGRALLEALDRRDTLPEPLRLELVDPLSGLPRLLRRLITRLGELGAEVGELAQPTAARPLALQAVLDALASPAPDAQALPPGQGVIVLDAETPWEAGELVAAWLKDHPDPRRTLVTAAETAWLDAALARRGLPALGQSAASPWRPALQLLPLRLSLGFAPRDPRFALELLTLPTPPVPRRLASKLLGALMQSPGIGGPSWNAAVAAARAELEPEAVDGAVERWFGGPLHDPDAGMPISEITRICQIVRDHARARAHLPTGADGEPDDALARAASIADELARAAASLGSGEAADRRVPWIQLLQIHDAIAGAGTSRADAVAEAGRPALCATPAGVLPGADEVIWWGFIGEAAGDAGTDPWTPRELRGLREAGVDVPEPGERRRAEARGWRRPFECAAHSVVLVRWRLAGASPTTPHPFADELAARLGPGALDGVTLRAEDLLGAADDRAPGAWRPETHQRPPAAPPTPRALWRLPPATLVPSGDLSPSAFEALFGCPLKWTLHYAARLRPGAGDGLPDDGRVIGTFAHRLIQTLLLEGPGPADADTAYQQVADDFDRSVAGEAATLLRPGRDLELRRARDTIAAAARGLVQTLAEAGLRPIGKETATRGTLAGQPWKGSADLVLEGPRGKAVLDLKQGGAAYRKEALAKGAALQLALYAQGLATPAGALPPAGFFIVRDQRLLTVDGDAFTGAETVEGPSLGETLLLAERAFRYWRRVMDQGLVPARGLPSEDTDAACAAAAGEPAPTEGPGAVEAPCRFCDFSALCATAVVTSDAAEAP